MYLQHFGLTDKPFQISPDPKFLWLGEKHKEAFANLLYSMIDQNGFLVLTGDVGSGKTTLLNALKKRLDSNVIVAAITNPKMSVMDMLQYIAISFDSSAKCASKVDFIVHMNHFFHKAEAEGKRILLIVDEAHLLTFDQLEEIRLLSNIESSGKKLINILLTGQNELSDKINSEKCRALRQRVALYYHLQPFSEQETAQYISHRLSIAGTKKAIFKPKAISEIQWLSQGVPRLINIICARALLSAYANGDKTIDEQDIRESGHDLHLGGQKHRVYEKLKPMKRAHRFLFKTALAAAIAALFVAPVIYLSPLGQPNYKRIAPARLIGSAFGTNRQSIAKPEASEKAAAAISLSEAPENEKKEVVKIGKHARDLDAFSISEASIQKRDFSEKPTDVTEQKIEEKKILQDADLQETAFSTAVESDAYSKELHSQELTGDAKSLKKQHRNEEAEALFLKAIELYPNNFEAHFELGKLYTETRDFNKAVDSYQKAIALKTDSAPAFYNLGFVYAATEAYPHAEEAFTRAAALEPSFADKVLFNLAVVQFRLGKKEDGYQNLKKSLALNPDNRRAAELLSKLPSNEKNP